VVLLASLTSVFHTYARADSLPLATHKLDQVVAVHPYTTTILG
jgi:hypothetical protein